MNAPDPCPRCRGVCKAVRGPVPDRWGVRCLECGLWADDREGTEAEAIAAWNRRAALPARRAAHVNETPKSEHDGADVLTDAAQAREEALRKAENAVIAKRAACATSDELRGLALAEDALLALINEARDD